MPKIKKNVEVEHDGFQKQDVFLSGAFVLGSIFWTSGTSMSNRLIVTQERAACSRKHFFQKQRSIL